MEAIEQERPARQKRLEPQDGGVAWKWACGIGLVLIFLLGFFTGPGEEGVSAAVSWNTQQVHALGMAMYSYAEDHHGAYPDGNNSTEVFQQLLDQGYVTDPKIFYVAMEGKSEAAWGQKKLKPENVCWDITDGVGERDPNRVPLVFLTGYRISYVPNGGIELVVKSRPPFLSHHSAYIFVYYTDNSVDRIVGLEKGSFFQTKTYTFWKVVPSDFDPHGKTYRQLTPDGVLK